MELRGAVTIEKVANAFGWSELTVWDLIRQRVLNWGTHLGRVVVSYAEVKAWVQEHPELAKKLSKPVVGDHALSGYFKKRRRNG